MYYLGITIEELSKSWTIIQGFNLEGQRSIGRIRVKLVMSDRSTSFILHVIDIKTFYKLLFGWPWLHECRIFAYTLHQCLKYYGGGERNINGNVKPFSKA